MTNPVLTYRIEELDEQQAKLVDELSEQWDTLAFDRRELLLDKLNKTLKELTVLRRMNG